MTPTRFVKFQALGNDYIVIEASSLPASMTPNDFARRICEPHYGAGADGIAVVETARDEGVDFDVRIFNPDGTEAGLSGNGTRCAAAYLHRTGAHPAEELRLRTPARAVLYRLREHDGRGHYTFESELGHPTFDAKTLPATLAAEPPIVDHPLSLANGGDIAVTLLSVGNPHCAIFVEDFDWLDWRALGAEIERHELFPERTNVEFVRVMDRSQIEVRIWERGVGVTHASGTCTSAAAIASMITDRCERTIEAITIGGRVQIEWREQDDMIVLVGAVEAVYQGDWLGAIVGASDRTT